ncbi:MAG: hypothetical protein N2041_14120, partial [Tepidiforma sp.]
MIPYDALRATMLGHVRRHFRRLARLAALGVPVVQAETPPPVPDNEFLARQLARVVPEVDAGRIPPPALRYKIWRLHGSGFGEFCPARGMSCRRNPPGIAGASGFLRRPRRRDAVHGNARYGAALAGRVEEFACRRRRSGARASGSSAPSAPGSGRTASRRRRSSRPTAPSTVPRCAA